MKMIVDVHNNTITIGSESNIIVYKICTEPLISFILDGYTVNENLTDQYNDYVFLRKGTHFVAVKK